MYNIGSVLEETFDGYTIQAVPIEKAPEKWSVSTIISRQTNDNMQKKRFYAKDKIYYILEIEAAKECINLGKNLIKKNMVGF